MYIFKVNGKKYKIQYNYRALMTTDVIDKLVEVGDVTQREDPAKMLKGIIGLTAEMLLAGLQANHKNDFGYDTEEEKNERILDTLDLMDAFEAENTDEDGNCSEDAFTLFSKLQNELESVHFLSSMANSTRQVVEEQNATVVPMDHQAKKKKAGEKK